MDSELGFHQSTTTDVRGENITTVADRHEVDPALLAVSVLIKVFESVPTATLVKATESLTIEQVVLRLIIISAATAMPRIEVIEGPLA